MEMTEQLAQILASAQSRAGQESLQQSEIEAMQMDPYDPESDPPFSASLADGFVTGAETYGKKTNGQAGRTGRQTGGQTGRQTGRRGRQTDGWTDRQASSKIHGL